MKDFEVRLYIDGRLVVFYGNDINRNTTDGGGNQVLYARCWELTEDEKPVRRGVINLDPNWTVKSLYWE